MNRDSSVKALLTVIKNSKKCESIEKHIFNKVGKDDNIYKWCIYQIIGLVIQGETYPKNIVKNDKIGWKCPCYDSITSKMEEYDSYLTNPIEVVEGISECGECHSKKTWSVQKQIRGGDEPMTTFSKCANCGHSWKYSG